MKLLNASLRAATLIFIYSISTAGASEYDSDDRRCLPNFTGPDCSIPYENCSDGKHRCFNNARCVRNNRHPVTGEYSYKCDCSFAADVSSYAGHECEHSATVLCESNKRNRESSNVQHYCKNGGICGEYVYRAQIHSGCHCPVDFAGAHCQYLKVEFDSIEGEALIKSVGDNFYGRTPEQNDNNAMTGIVTCLILGSISIVMLALGKAFSLRKSGGVISLKNNITISNESYADGPRFEMKVTKSAEII